MNQLRRKGRSKRRNSKLRKSRRKTRVKRQYKWTASRVKRNTYRKNRKRRSTRKMRGGAAPGGMHSDAGKEMRREADEYAPAATSELPLIERQVIEAARQKQEELDRLIIELGEEHDEVVRASAELEEYKKKERQRLLKIENIKKKIEGNIEIMFRKDIEQLNRQIDKFGENASLVKGARERLEKKMETERQRLMQRLM